MPALRELLVVAFALGACYRPFGPEAERDSDSAGDADATEDEGISPSVAIDILWVIDNSSSMCQEQAILGRTLSDFADRLRGLGVDLRVAVTTSDVQCEVNGTTIFSARGAFNRHAARHFPPTCQEARRVACVTDDDCAGLDCSLPGSSCGEDEGKWACRSTTELCITNPNGSINTLCRRRCTSDEECVRAFGDASFVCQKPSANEADWGCIRPPDTAGCPSDLSFSFLGQAEIDDAATDLFPCIATVGVNQEECYTVEQPLRAGLMALDPDGENREQAASFLRPDAYLVVAFVTDEDDCSIPEGASLADDEVEICGLLPTTDDGGPLTPVGTYVERYKALKSDPDRVVVVAIAGDSLAKNPADFASERDAYRRSKSEPRLCYRQSYICSSDTGTAELGARLLEFTHGFGTNGLFRNICDPGSLNLLLPDVVDFLATTTGN